MERSAAVYVRRVQPAFCQQPGDQQPGEVVGPALKADSNHRWCVAVEAESNHRWCAAVEAESNHRWCAAVEAESNHRWLMHRSLLRLPRLYDHVSSFCASWRYGRDRLYRQLGLPRTYLESSVWPPAQAHMSGVIFRLLVRSTNSGDT